VSKTVTSGQPERSSSLLHQGVGVPSISPPGPKASAARLLLQPLQQLLGSAGAVILPSVEVYFHHCHESEGSEGTARESVGKDTAPGDSKLQLTLAV